MTYDFSLDRKATATLGAGSALLLILVFIAGVLTGLTWRSDQDLMAVRKPAVVVEKAAGAAEGAGRMQMANVAPPPAGLPMPPAASMAMAAAPSATNTASNQAPAPPATAASQAPEIPGVQLAIQVGAFLERANADKLADRLKEEGYASEVVLGGHPPKQWNFVRVGPYRDWEEASQIAAVLSRDQATRAVVQPIR